MPQKRDKNSGFSKDFRKKLSELRKETGMTQIDFAKFVGVSSSSIGLYETGERIPDAEILCRIAQKCNVSADYLLGLQKEPVLNEDAKAVCKYTGLSEEAVHTLHKIADDAANYDEFEEEIIQLYGEDLNQEIKKQRSAYLDFISYCFYSDEASDFMGVLEYAIEYKNQLANWNARAKKLLEDFKEPQNANLNTLYEIYDERAEMTKYDYIKVRSYIHEAADCLKMVINDYVSDLSEEQEKLEKLLIREITPYRISNKLKEGEADGEHN